MPSRSSCEHHIRREALRDSRKSTHPLWTWVLHLQNEGGCLGHEPSGHSQLEACAWPSKDVFQKRKVEAVEMDYYY